MSARRSGKLAERERKARWQRALERPELLWPGAKREPAAGPTSMAVKAEDPEVRRLVDEALAARRRG